MSSGKGFPLEKFALVLAEISLDDAGVYVDRMVPLAYENPRDKYGVFATGRGTKDAFAIFEGQMRGGGDDRSSTGDCEAVIPGFDAGGIDPEDIQPLKNGMNIASDEYGKVIVFDAYTGVIRVTYIPYGTIGITSVRPPHVGAGRDGGWCR